MEISVATCVEVCDAQTKLPFYFYNKRTIAFPTVGGWCFFLNLVRPEAQLCFTDILQYWPPYVL